MRFDDDLVGDPLEKACLTWCDWSLTKGLHFSFLSRCCRCCCIHFYLFCLVDFFSGDAVLPPKGSKQTGLKIFHRYHFSSAMKRMTVVAGFHLPGFQEPKMIVAVKGAPETLRSMVSSVSSASMTLSMIFFQYESVPQDYDEIFTNLTRQGARVLAMGIKELQQTRLGEVRTASKSSVFLEL